jgi:hypothetical protein
MFKLSYKNTYLIEFCKSDSFFIRSDAFIKTWFIAYSNI